MKHVLTPEQRRAYIEAKLWCMYHNTTRWLAALMARAPKPSPLKPTITSRAVNQCVDACAEGAFGLSHIRCREGCARAERVVMAITATDDEHRAAHWFWPTDMRGTDR